jgi:hypothetical protein
MNTIDQDDLCRTIGMHERRHGRCIHCGLWFDRAEWERQFAHGYVLPRHFKEVSRILTARQAKHTWSKGTYSWRLLGLKYPKELVDQLSLYVLSSDEAEHLTGLNFCGEKLP